MNKLQVIPGKLSLTLSKVKWGRGEEGHPQDSQGRDRTGAPWVLSRLVTNCPEMASAHLSSMHEEGFCILPTEQGLALRRCSIET